MPDDYTDKRNGAYDAVTPVGKEPYFRTDEEGHVQQVWKNPIPLRLEREAAPPLNPRTGRNPAK
jgi:hypothetical protein